MAHDRIEVIYRSYVDEKNAWMSTNGQATLDWDVYRKMRVDEDISNCNSRTETGKYEASWRWSCYVESYIYNKRRENYKLANFEIYYKRLVPRGRAEPAWSALLHLPTRRRALDGTILEMAPEWTEEEQHALIDFVMLQDQHELKDNNSTSSGADERWLAGLVEYGVIPSLDQLTRLMPRRQTGWFEEVRRIDMAKAAKRRTMEITSWDDNDKIPGPDETDREILNYNLDRWKVFVRTGAFPKVNT